MCMKVKRMLKHTKWYKVGDLIPLSISFIPVGFSKTTGADMCRVWWVLCKNLDLRHILCLKTWLPRRLDDVDNFRIRLGLMKHVRGRRGHIWPKRTGSGNCVNRKEGVSNCKKREKLVKVRSRGGCGNFHTCARYIRGQFWLDGGSFGRDNKCFRLSAHGAFG